MEDMGLWWRVPLGIFGLIWAGCAFNNIYDILKYGTTLVPPHFHPTPRLMIGWIAHTLFGLGLVGLALLGWLI